MRPINRFTVICPPTIFNLGVFLIAIMVALAVIYTLTTEPPHIVMYICFVLIILPFAIGMLYTKMFKVTVEGSTVTVRKTLGFKYSFDVSEIERIDWKISLTAMGKIEKITVRTTKKKFTVENLMIGSDEMIAFLKENVAGGKIRTKIKKFGL